MVKMIDARTALEEAAGLALEHGIGSGWKRLAPLSTGAIAGGAMVVGLGVIVKHLLGPRARRAFSLAGVAALLPLALLLLTPAEAEAEATEPAESNGEQPGKDG